MTFTQLPSRESDQRVFIADITKAKRMIDWYPRVSKEDGINKMIEWLSLT